MLQQRRIEILYHKFPEIFRGIIPEKYRYFSGKIPEEISGSELPTVCVFFVCFKHASGQMSLCFLLNVTLLILIYVNFSACNVYAYIYVSSIIMVRTGHLCHSYSFIHIRLLDTLTERNCR